MTVLDWLLDSDPSLRWQVLRDLAGAAPEAVAAERARVATEGWGARLLALRDDDGQWAQAHTSPPRRQSRKRRFEADGADDAGGDEGWDRGPAVDCDDVQLAPAA